ncbi:oxidoreductase [Kitasatospora sp. NPDC057198]|uniref:oxidoreductase n=1 Tax=Kitasatospora sp. NPDC057198 TaxID=3346046 RepID=UPI00362622BC
MTTDATNDTPTDTTTGTTAEAAQRPLGSPFSAASTAREVLAGRDLSGTTAVVTGGYSGLGLATTLALTAAGARVLVPARRPDTARAALAAAEGAGAEGAGAAAGTAGPGRAEVVPMDLADLGSVRSAAALIRDRCDRLDLLMAVAGVMATPERRVGPGWEGQLAVNHFGHFALACELHPLLAAAAAATGGARVVVNSSAGHALSGVRWHDPHFRTGYDKWLAYGQAKTANALFAVHLDALGREHGIRAFALHPGRIITGLQREMTLREQVERGWVNERGEVVGAGFKSPEQGAATGVWAAVSPLLDGLGGRYLEDCEVARISAPGTPVDDGGVRGYAVDPEQAARLWELSLAATGAPPIGR